MKTLTINGDEITIPSWNTYSKKQLLQLAKLITNNIPVTYFCIKALFIIINLKIVKKKQHKIDDEDCFFVKHGKKRYLVGETDMAAITMKLREHFFNQNEREGKILYKINPDLYKSTLNFILISKKRYYAPSHALSNFIFEEYIYTETYFSRFLKDKKEEHINNLISVLYRPRPHLFNHGSIKKTGDKREPFNIFVCKTRSNVFSKLPEHYKKVIIWYYIGCRNFIFGKFSYIFRNSGGSSNNMDPFESFMELTIQLSGSAMNNEKVRKTLLYDVLSELNEKIKIQQKKPLTINH